MNPEFVLVSPPGWSSPSVAIAGRDGLLLTWVEPRAPPKEGKSAFFPGALSGDALAAVTGEQGAGAAGVQRVKARDTAKRADRAAGQVLLQSYPVPKRQEGGG